MKNFTFLIVTLFAGFSAMAGQTDGQHSAGGTHRAQTINMGSHLSLKNAVNNNNHKRSLQWELIAERQDEYDDTTSAWVFEDSVQLAYDMHGNRDTEVVLEYAAGNWENYEAIYYTYNYNVISYAILLEWNAIGQTWTPAEDVTQTLDAHNNVLQSTYREWNMYTNNWQSYFQNIYTYDANNSELTDIYQYWDSASASWLNSTKYLYTNDTHGNHLTEVNQAWNGSAWENSYQYLYTYNANNNNTQETVQYWDSAAVSWDNDNKYNYTFDANNNNTVEETYYWNSNTSVWDTGYLYQYTFVDVNKPSTELYQYWDDNNNVWVNYYKNSYTYDGSFNKTGFTDSYWNTNTNAWVGNYNDTYTYDGNNNLIYELDQDYNTNNLTYENSNQEYYYYKQLNISGISEVKNQLDAAIYPNPSTGSNITLSLALDNDAKVRIGLYDAQGKLVTTQLEQFMAGSNNMQLNYSNVSSGNYYIQVLEYATGKSSVLKFVKQ